MLAEMTPAEMSERIAAEVLEEEKRNRFAEILKLGFAGICTALRLEVSPEYFEPDRKRVGGVQQGATQTADGDGPLVSPRVASARMVGILGPPNRRKG